jgi:hypothetical protein
VQGEDVVLRRERVFGSRDLDFDGAHDGARLRRCDARVLEDLKRFRLHRHRW